MSNYGNPDQIYSDVIAQYGDALARLAVGYEANAERRRDLLQEIHIALWRSLSKFDGRCSLRTWAYRVGHNVAINHVVRNKRENHVQVSLDELDDMTHPTAIDDIADHDAFERLRAMIHSLKPTDRQIMLLYLDDVDAASIGEIVGLSANNIATKIHRIKRLLVRNFNARGANNGGSHD